MDYFLIKQLGSIAVPKAPRSETADPEEPSVRIMKDVHTLEKFDYLAEEILVSSRMKQLLEQYLPEQIWKPCVFVDPSKQAQAVFWFLPPLPYAPKQVVTASSGIPCSLRIEEEDFAKKSPGMFRIRNTRGMLFFIVHLSVAESLLRRGICGLEFVRLSE